MFIILFRPFVAGLELTLHRHMLSQKTPSIIISHDFQIFKGMSHNLEILRFQKMDGLLGFIKEMKALQRSARGRF